MLFPLKKTLLAVLMFTALSEVYAVPRQRFPPADATCEALLPLYLVAHPKVPANLVVGLPKELKSRRTGRMKRYLWVGIKGEQEALALKRRLGLTDEENLRLLKETGVLLRLDANRN